MPFQKWMLTSRIVNSKVEYKCIRYISIHCSYMKKILEKKINFQRLWHSRELQYLTTRKLGKIHHFIIKFTYSKENWSSDTKNEMQFNYRAELPMWFYSNNITIRKNILHSFKQVTPSYIHHEYYIIHLFSLKKNIYIKYFRSLSGDFHFHMIPLFVSSPRFKNSMHID